MFSLVILIFATVGYLCITKDPIEKCNARYVEMRKPYHDKNIIEKVFD